MVRGEGRREGGRGRLRGEGGGEGRGKEGRREEGRREGGERDRGEREEKGEGGGRKGSVYSFRLANCSKKQSFMLGIH